MSVKGKHPTHHKYPLTALSTGYATCTRTPCPIQVELRSEQVYAPALVSTANVLNGARTVASSPSMTLKSPVM